MDAYEKYLSDMKRLGASKPYMTEQQFKEAYGIKDKDTFKPLTLTPKRDSRKVAASLDNFIKAAESSKRRKTLKVSEPKPKKIRAEKKPQKKEKVIRLPKTDRKMSPKTSLSGMTEEEKKAHKLKQNREWKRKRYPAKERPPKMTIEEKRAKHRERYHKNKPPITRIFYKDLTEEQLKAHLKEQRRLQTIKNKDKRKAYKEANKEKVKQWHKDWEEKNKEKRLAINKKYKEENKEKVLESSRKWNENNPERRKEIQARADAKRRNKQPKDLQGLSQTETQKSILS